MTPAWWSPYPDSMNAGAPSAELDWAAITEVARPLLKPVTLAAWVLVSLWLLL